MNKLRQLKNRSGHQTLHIAGSPSSSAPPQSTADGVFTKLTRRYANVKFLRHPVGRSGRSGAAGHAQPVVSGSYDLTTAELKREIGAPILISKTCIDMDMTDCRPDISDPQPQHKSMPNSPKPPADLDEDVHEHFPYGDPGHNPLGVPCRSSTVLRKTRSKSAGNLHKSELRVVLQSRAPSLKSVEPNNNSACNRFDADEANDAYDVVRSSQHRHSVYQSMAGVSTFCSADRRSAGHSPELYVNGSLAQQHFMHVPQQQQRSTSTSRYSSKDSLNQSTPLRFSRDSLAPETAVEASPNRSPAQAALDASELFRSIDEMNERTQRNEPADGEVDREYCEHRDQLRPDQRRITLLRNKGTSVLNLQHALKRSERLGNAWNGLKHWIGEEGGRIREVVHKHAAMQRVGAQYQSTMLATSADAKHSDATESGCEDDGQTLKRKNSKQSSSSASVAGDETVEGQNGFEELRRYVKQGGDFGKELAAILQERVDSEQLYAKSLSKMASKLNKACRDIPGSLAEGWRGVAAEMENRSEVHRLFSASLVDEIVKPLRAILDTQHKTRKSIENAVDKSARVLAEWRTTEAKAKKSSHVAARENEKVQDAMLDVRIQRSPSVAMLHHQVSQSKTPDKEQKTVDKDCAKLDNKRRKAEESVKRADVEYYTLCIRSERARVEWEMAVLRGATVLQSHENQRLASLKASLSDYLRFSQLINPGTYQICERLAPLVTACNVQKDLNVVKNIRRASEGPSEQLLPDFYCEHTTLAMNRERRKQALIKLLQLVRTDLERERKSRTGLQVIAQSLNTPDNPNVADKMYHIRSMLTYLEGARFKLQSALHELDHQPRGTHPLAAHIQITRDRTGLQQSILKVPLWLRNGDDTDRLNDDYYGGGSAGSSSESDVSDHQLAGDAETEGHNDVLIKHFDRDFKRSPSNLDGTIVVLTGGAANSRERRSDAFDRGQADGGSNQPDSDFDEFSSQDEDDELGHVKHRIHSASGPSLSPDGATSSDASGSSSAPSPAQKTPLVLSRCRAIYHYEPQLHDELELKPGDLLEVHSKPDDGWWMGALNNRVGIFPATYVEEVKMAT